MSPALWGLPWQRRLPRWTASTCQQTCQSGALPRQGHTKTKGNFAKAAFNALAQAYSFLTPDLWRETKFTKQPYQEHTDYLAKTHTVKRGGSSLLASNQPQMMNQ